MVPQPETKIVILLEGDVEHDHGSSYDKFLMEFFDWVDFLNWICLATQMIKDNQYIALDHYHYHTYEMRVKKITFSGTMEKKMVRSYLDGKGKAIP